MTDTPRCDEVFEKNARSSDVQCAIAYIALAQTLEQDLAAAQAALEAWQSVFGTSQLSHAKARLEAAEEGQKRAQAALEEARKACWLVRSIGGEGPPGHMFCYTPEDVREAFSLLCFGSVDDAEQDVIDKYMESFNDPEHWDGEGTHWILTFEIDGLEAIKLDPCAALKGAK